MLKVKEELISTLSGMPPVHLITIRIRRHIHSDISHWKEDEVAECIQVTATLDSKGPREM